MNLTDVFRLFQLHPDAVAVWVLAPYLDTAQGMVSEHYDKPVTRQELDAAFKALGLPWYWQPVTMNNMRAVVREISASSSTRVPIVLNYCDGDELNGYPGLTVVRLLEEAHLIFTGADAAFYERTTSKIPMKEAFTSCGVPTAPFAIIPEDKAAPANLFDRLGSPLLVKPAISAGSYGLSIRSVVRTEAELSRQLEHLSNGGHDWNVTAGGIFVERFIMGPEYTVFLVGSPAHPETVRIYPPLERVFNRRLPETERFFSFERYWEQYEEETPLPSGERFYEVRLADPAMWEELGDISWKAYCAVGGKGYARIDLRQDNKSGAVYVLEVNSNCGISSPADDSSVGRILEQADIPFEQLISEILIEALFRHASIFNPKTIPP